MASCYPNDYSASLSASDVSPFHFSTGRCLRPQLYAAAETEARRMWDFLIQFFLGFFMDILIYTKYTFVGYT